MKVKARMRFLRWGLQVSGGRECALNLLAPGFFHSFREEPQCDTRLLEGVVPIPLNRDREPSVPPDEYRDLNKVQS